MMNHPYPTLSSQDLLDIARFISKFLNLPPLAPSAQHLKYLNILYRRFGRLVSNLSRRYVVLVLPLVRQKLHWAFFLALAKAYFTWWKRVILEPKGIVEKMVKKQGIVLLLAALKGRFVTARPQPAPQSPASSLAGCSPLELVIGTLLDISNNWLWL
jgi:hypothetical protein